MTDTTSQDAQDVELVRETLRALLRDAGTPAPAKAQAARTLAEMAGALGRYAAPPEPADLPAVATLDRAGLEAALAAALAGKPA